jgi:hypothetical protein
MLNFLTAVLIFGGLQLATDAPSEERGGDVYCNEFEAGEGGVTDCVLMLGERGFLTFSYTPSQSDHTLIVGQHSFDGATELYSNPLSIENPHAAPALRDINGNGNEELFIPLMTGNVNTVFSVWQQDADGVYQPAGEISGFAVEFYEIRDGFIITYSRGNAYTHYESAMNLGPDGFTTIYELEINYHTEVCTVNANADLTDYGLTEDEITGKCAARSFG